MKILKSTSFWISLGSGLLIAIIAYFVFIDKYKISHKDATKDVYGDAAAISDSLNIARGDSIYFIGKYHGSVGETYTTDYNHDSISCRTTKLIPKDCMSGGDEGSIIFVYKPKYVGNNIITINKLFRDSVESSEIYTVIIK